MDYRPAGLADIPTITEYINEKNYWGPVDAAALGGYWLVAMQGDKVRGTIWAFASGPNAYIGYWIGETPQIAAKLGALLYHALQMAGVKYVHASIASDNAAAKRMASDLFGMVVMDNYSLAFKGL